MREICAHTLMSLNSNSPLEDDMELFLNLPNTGVPKENIDLLYAYARAFTNIMKPHMEITDEWILNEIENDPILEDILINPVDRTKLSIDFNRAAQGTAKYQYSGADYIFDDYARCTCKVIFSKKTDWFQMVTTIGHELIHYINHYEIGMRFHKESWSKSHGPKFGRYVKIINDYMRNIGSDFRMTYKVNRWHRYPEVIDTQDWMRDNIQIGDDIIWNWGEHVGIARVTRRNSHTLSVRHITGHAFRIRNSIPWEVILYAYRIDCPYDITKALENDKRLFTGARIIDIHDKEMQELKKIWE